MKYDVNDIANILTDDPDIFSEEVKPVPCPCGRTISTTQAQCDCGRFKTKILKDKSND